jgi:Do/DeqQ family serine protease
MPKQGARLRGKNGAVHGFMKVSPSPQAALMAKTVNVPIRRVLAMSTGTVFERASGDQMELSHARVVSSTRRAIRLILAVSLCIAAFASAALARAPLLDEQRGVLTMAPVLEKVMPAVVSISVQSRAPGADNPLFRDPFFRRFFGQPDMPEPRVMSAGSGVIIDAKKGHVVTNHHVVRNADKITVTVKDGRQFAAKLLGSDEATDIALLDVEASGLAELPLGDSDALKVGDVVLAIGNPFGLSQTVTSGIVSALGRAGLDIDKYEDFIQTDAPINPGNSGGALINSRGELMGINTAIIAPAGGNVGIGFAIPSNIARAVVDQLLKYGEVRRGRIGVTIQTGTPDIAKALGAPVERGVVINSVESNSPAEEAGLKAGDFITSIDGKPVANANDVRNRVGLRERGSKVDVTYYREGRTHTATITIGEPKVAAADVHSAAPQLAGARFVELSPDHPANGRSEGLLATEVQAGSPAWRVGLRAGDVVVAVNRQPVRSIADLEDATKKNPGVLALNILRGDAQLFIVAQG